MALGFMHRCKGVGGACLLTWKKEGAPSACFCRGCLESKKVEKHCSRDLGPKGILGFLLSIPLAGVSPQHGHPAILKRFKREELVNLHNADLFQIWSAPKKSDIWSISKECLYKPLISEPHLVKCFLLFTPGTTALHYLSVSLGNTAQPQRVRATTM